MTKKRDYKKEYREYHGKPQQIKERAQRVQARRNVKKTRSLKTTEEVDHKRPLAKGGSNAKSNLRVVDRHTNRTRKKPKRATR